MNAGYRLRSQSRINSVQQLNVTRTITVAGAPPDIADLGGVSISAPSNGQVLAWNGSAWVNAAGRVPAEILSTAAGLIGNGTASTTRLVGTLAGQTLTFTAYLAGASDSSTSLAVDLSSLISGTMDISAQLVGVLDNGNAVVAAYSATAQAAGATIAPSAGASQFKSGVLSGTIKFT